MKAIYRSGNYHNKVLYSIVPNGLVDINHQTGEIHVKETWNGTTGIITVQIIATDLSKKAGFKPMLVLKFFRTITKAIIESY